ncbi:hypothetical protein DB30_05595 [Enhygromyxa salina]|uniref:Uncharacterized protein n=1 Tax=Enhygromyxa salina TaxID=215803 RepID=A0A0C1ZCI0_9BACT|nr:hypothetical protein [Enhygromyxa salina]KIG15399.1 hypothetical protein DB30_05595 [Enhygromyxa salina]
MADKDDQVASSEGPLAWLSKRAGLVILVIIGAIVGLRLMSSWIKWLLIAMVVGALFYLVKSATGSEPKSGTKSD